MADEEKDKKEEAPPPKKSKKKLIIIIAAAVVVLGGAAGGFFFLKGGGNADANTDSHAAAEAKGKDSHASKDSHGAKGEHGAEGDASGSSMVQLNPFIVNLRDNSGTRYLKLTLNLELDSAASAEDLKAQDSKIRDSVIILLSSKSYSDIGTVEGKYQLRDEIVMRVNQFLEGNKVKTAYFTEFVIQ